MKFGITGGIGSGKSYICNMLKAEGFPVYNCDDEAKRLMVEDMEIISSLRNLIGNEAYIEQKAFGGKSNFTLNKQLIASYLFANTEHATKVNAIVHPQVKKDFNRWADAQDTKHVIMECAILFESGFDNVIDKSILIYADEEKRLARAMKRDNATESQILHRMQQQINGEEARLRADYILDHNEYETTNDEVRKLILWINKFD